MLYEICEAAAGRSQPTVAEVPTAVGRILCQHRVLSRNETETQDGNEGELIPSHDAGRQTNKKGHATHLYIRGMVSIGIGCASLGALP